MIIKMLASGLSIILTILLFWGSALSYAADYDDEIVNYEDGVIKERISYYGKDAVKRRQFYREDGTMDKYIDYDTFGQKIQEANLNSHGGLEDGVDGWAAMRWYYDGRTLISESVYGTDGQIKERKLYSHSGDLINKQYYGDYEPDPYEEYDPLPSLPGESIEDFDSYGNPKGAVTAYS